MPVLGDHIAVGFADLQGIRAVKLAGLQIPEQGESGELQVLLFGSPPLLLGLALLRRLAPMQRVATGALLGAAAGAIPGLLMQMACMYLPEHILSHHIAPIFLLTALGAGLGPVVLRRL